MKNSELTKLYQMSKNLKILYVEDDDFIMESMKTLLGDIFANVTTASDGVEAIEMLRGRDFDILLTDAVMPKMDGLELIKTLRDENISPQIGVISAMDEDMIEKFKTLGVVELIEKPIEPPALFGSLIRLCEAALKKN